MNYIQLLNEIFQVCIIPLLGILTTYLIKLIQQKSNEISVKTNDELTNKYLSLLTETVVNCVKATNQTYVENLKNQNAFTKEAQQEAFNKTYDAVMAIIGEEVKKNLELAVGDFNLYVCELIEANVNSNK